MPARRPAKRRVAIDQLLVWTYADQRAHDYLRRPLDWFLWALDDAGFAERRGDRRPVRHDAALVHEAVLSLPAEERDLVIAQALARSAPAALAAVPRPVPVEPASRGERREHLVLSAATLVYDEHAWEAVLRGDRARHQGWIRTARPALPDERHYPGWARRQAAAQPGRWVAVEAPYCPIAWHPDPVRIAAHNRRARLWRETLTALEVRLAAAPLRDHRLVRRRRTISGGA